MNAWMPEQRYRPATKKLYETRLNNPRFRHVRWGALTAERHRAWAKPRAQLAYLARVWR